MNYIVEFIPEPCELLINDRELSSILLERFRTDHASTREEIGLLLAQVFQCLYHNALLYDWRKEEVGRQLLELLGNEEETEESGEEESEVMVG
jgi:hypothetical protein